MSLKTIEVQAEKSIYSEINQGPTGSSMSKKLQLKSDLPFVEGLKAREIQDINIEEIAIGDITFQYRFSANVGDLKHSLSQEGQKEPIDLTGNKPYRIIDGFRRVEASRALGWKTIKSIVHKGISDDDAHKLAFIKNVVRKNLSPMDKANAIYLAKKRGTKAPQLAEFFCLSEKQIKRYEDLLDFPQDIQKLLDKEALSMCHAKILSDFEISGKELADWAGKIKENKYSAKQLKREIKKTLGIKTAGRAKLYMKKVKNGIRMFPFIVDNNSPQPEREKVLKLLQEAIDVLKV